MSRQQLRQATLRHSRRPVVDCVVLMAALLAIASSCNRKSSPQAEGTQKAAAGSVVEGTPRPARAYDLKKPVVEIDTTLGKITVSLEGMLARGTVRNFLNYANGGFYDNTLVHYVDPGKMILAGGYTADHKAKRAGTPIRNEAHNGLKNARGTIAMARDAAAVDTASSQFFINLVDAPQRDHKGDSPEDYGYCVFGQVIEGLEIAEKISNGATEDLGGDLARTPNPPVVIKSIRAVH